LRSGAVSWVACNAWLGLLGVFIQIAIEIGIEIVPLIAVDDLILSNLVSPSTQTAQHCGHAVQLHLAALALRFVQGFVDNKDIGIGGAFQRRSACDFDSDFDSDFDFDDRNVGFRCANPTCKLCRLFLSHH
jgi:hypothetical protein